MVYYCNHCGELIGNKEKFCPRCGAKKIEKIQVSNYSGLYYWIFWGMLGFAIPVVSSVAYFLWKFNSSTTKEFIIISTVACVILFLCPFVISALVKHKRTMMQKEQLL